MNRQGQSQAGKTGLIPMAQIFKGVPDSNRKYIILFKRLQIWACYNYIPGSQHSATCPVNKFKKVVGIKLEITNSELTVKYN